MNVQLFRVFTLLFLLHNGATGTRFTVTLDAIDHGANTFEVGLILAMVSLLPAFFAVAAGRWVDRRGSRLSLWTSFACLFFGGLVSVLLPTSAVGIAPLFATCLLIGVSFLLTNTTLQRLTGDFAGAEFRTTSFVVFSMVTAVSGLVTPVAAGYAIEHWGFGSFYLWTLLVGAGLFLLSFTPVFSRVMTVKRGAKKASAEKKGSAVDFLKLSAMRAVLISSVLISVAWEVGNLMIPVYCRSASLTPSQIGWILGSFSVASFCVRLLMPILMVHLGEWRLISLTMLVSGLAFIAFPAFENVFALMACAFVLGMGLGASLPNMMSLVYRLAPPERVGEAIGLRLMMINMSKSTFPIAMGALGTIIGAGSSLFGLGLFMLGGFGYATHAAGSVNRACAKHAAGRPVQKVAGGEDEEEEKEEEEGEKT